MISKSDTLIFFLFEELNGNKFDGNPQKWAKKRVRRQETVKNNFLDRTSFSKSNSKRATGEGGGGTQRRICKNRASMAVTTTTTTTTTSMTTTTAAVANTKKKKKSSKTITSTVHCSNPNGRLREENNASQKMKWINAEGGIGNLY